MLHAVASDDVTRLDVIGQDHHLLADGAARRLHGSHRPDPVFFARPERETRSVGAVAVIEIAARDPGRDGKLLATSGAEGGSHLSLAAHPAAPLRSLGRRGDRALEARLLHCADHVFSAHLARVVPHYLLRRVEIDIGLLDSREPFQGSPDPLGSRLRSGHSPNQQCDFLEVFGRSDGAPYPREGERQETNTEHPPRHNRFLFLFAVYRPPSLG